MAGISKSTHYTPGLKRKLSNSAYNGFYFVAGDKKQAQMEFFKANPDVNTAKCVLSLMENKNINNMILAPLPGVTFNQLIQIPKH